MDGGSYSNPGGSGLRLGGTAIIPGDTDPPGRSAPTTSPREVNTSLAMSPTASTTAPAASPTASTASPTASPTASTASPMAPPTLPMKSVNPIFTCPPARFLSPPGSSRHSRRDHLGDLLSEVARIDVLGIPELRDVDGDGTTPGVEHHGAEITAAARALVHGPRSGATVDLDAVEPRPVVPLAVRLHRVLPAHGESGPERSTVESAGGFGVDERLVVALSGETELGRFFRGQQLARVDVAQPLFLLFGARGLVTVGGSAGVGTAAATGNGQRRHQSTEEQRLRASSHC